MECISELKDSLNVYFGWNKARMACFVNMFDMGPDVWNEIKGK